MLEERVDQIMEAVNTLVQLQSGKSSTRLPAPSTPTPSSTANQLDEDRGLREGVSVFDPALSPDPPPEVLQSLVKLYVDQIADQPLPLFHIQSLSRSVRTFPKPLLRSFLALTVRYSDDQFFRCGRSNAVEFYKASASKALYAQAAEPTSDAEVLQAFCLLCLSEIADGNMKRAWMAVGVATRLAVCAGLMSSKVKGVIVSAEHSRCYWSLFILDRIHGSSFWGVPAIPAGNAAPEMPLSVKRPEYLELTSPNDLEEPQAAEEKDAGINSYALQLLSIWGRLMSYLKTISQGDLEDAWTANSTYQQIKAEMSRFETVLPEVHRFKNARFRERNISELERHRHYWASWVFTQCIYHTTHCTLNHPFLHIARIRGQRRLRSPSFLQHASDQAALHAAWVVLILSSCEERDFKIYDPFVGHLASMIATAEFLLQFSKDNALAAKSASNFNMLRRFIERMAASHPHLQHTTVKLTRLGQFATAHVERASDQPPKVEIALLWNLLDYAASSSPSVDSGESSDNVELNVNTQFLSPVNPDVPTASFASEGLRGSGQEGLDTSFWDGSTFEFDMTDFSNIHGLSDLSIPSETWIGGHL
ncbi:hypothetical protein A1O7_05607 [Cladophialophora yegresii CBS 114405]|uniref:Xylanolytic transcriptional activator regulatory domain-containing protein n=1 Tax=Cladophialophora yegresii CBS 114405 TaxID=1182544 RepID=W9VR28_9EURO|nr:uncharacterized protein A1O7_05607 [Cladophialophora yegresii CBS 114405]EXJ58182.1 hypothetical protein A1O7_05607 [Cladophialophora yegresii CBS 114405]